MVREPDELFTIWDRQKDCLVNSIRGKHRKFWEREGDARRAMKKVCGSSQDTERYYIKVYYLFPKEDDKNLAVWNAVYDRRHRLNNIDGQLELSAEV